MLDFLTKQLWVLPVWAWIAIGAGVLLLLIIIIAAAASKKKKRKGPRRPKAKKKASKKGKRLLQDVLTAQTPNLSVPKPTQI